MDKEGFYCEEVTPATDLENKMSLLHAELTDPYDRPASIPPDEPYVDLGLIGKSEISDIFFKYKHIFNKIHSIKINRIQLK